MAETKFINRLCRRPDFESIISHQKKSIIFVDNKHVCAVGLYIELKEVEGPKDKLTLRTCRVKITHVERLDYLPGHYSDYAIISIRIATGGTHPQAVIIKLDWRSKHDSEQLRLNLS